MAIQTSFAKKLTWLQDCDHRFLAMLGNDGELDLALLDVKNRVRDLSSPTLARNVLGSIAALAFFLMEGSLFLSRKGCPFPRLGRARRERV
jgi:hypothetical protein